jgi:hypothetical protein
MKHIKKHPINDKAQKLSKDMKKQELVKPKTDKKLDADKSLSDPDVSMRVVKPSNKKLDGEKFLSEGLKHLKRFNEMLDPMGKWTPETPEEDEEETKEETESINCYNCKCCLDNEPTIEYNDIEPESIGCKKCPQCGCNN